jgi:eukaryotic-like serine/threonine-protein kinase
MEPERWQKIKELFGAALERKPAERSSFVAQSCASDPALLAELQSLLAAHEETSATVSQAAAERLGAPEGSSLGRRIGPYQVLHRIALGGMAAVYLATRADDQYRKRVAIKLIPPGLDTEELLRRFRNERQTLAALDHPNIVKLLDGGSTDDGLPYLVMDYVEGTPINQYCDAHRLSITERLELFCKVCSAVGYAHERLVIHRDLKPGNILVTSDGTPKLLDFGIAKLLDPASSATLVITRTGQRLMTPEYASPEQVRGEPLTNATDVYSLGVVLYELLTGHRPYRLKSYTPLEIERAICETEPLKPSTMVTQVEQEWDEDGTKTTITPEAVSLTREGDAQKLRSRLHGDLDAIVLTALRKEPRRRYSSVYELSEDVRRHLKDLPITARPSTLSYRVGKFLRRHQELTVATLIFALVLLALGTFSFLHRSPKLTEKDTVVLAEFANSTGDPIFDGTLRQGLAAQLEQSPFLNLLSDQRIAQTLALMAQPKDARLTHELAGEVCQRTASAAALDGSISQIGTRYLLTLKAVNCSNGESLASTEAQASDKNHVLDALGKVASEIRRKLGESLASVQKYDELADNVTTPSLEALKAYNLAYQAMVVKADCPAAVSLFQRAISLDPNFAMAYARLGICYSNLNETARAAENTRKAYQLRERVSEREKLYIASHYDEVFTGNLEAARRTEELWAQTYPRDNVPPHNLGIIYAYLGDYDKSLAASQEVLKLNPGSGSAYATLVSSYLYLNRLDEAKATVQEAQAHNLDSPLMHLRLYSLDFLEHNAEGMEHEAAGLIGKPGYEDQVLFNESDTAAFFGQVAKARGLMQRAVESAQRADEKETAAGYEVEAALREALVGNMGLAKQDVRAALALSKGRDILGMSALALGWAGDSAQATLLASDLDKRFPEDTIAQFNYLPAIHAIVALRGNENAKAVQALAAATPYELGIVSSLYPVYLRGDAYLRAKQGTAAAVEFQKIFDHPGVVGNGLIGVLAHLELGRAFALSGDVSKARTAYQHFLTLWKEADPDIPILKQAKVEYTRL